MDIKIKIEKMIHQMFEGESLKKVLKSEGIHPASFFNTVYDDQRLLTLYHRAQVARAEVFADEIIEIADTEDDPQRARVRTENRRWYASKMQPNKYGDRLDLNVNQTVDIGHALKEARKRLLPTCDPDNDAIGQLPEPIQLPMVCASGLSPDSLEAIEFVAESKATDNSDLDIFK